MQIFQEFFRWAGYALVNFAIIWLGWKQPLSYYFKSPAEVIEAERFAMFGGGVAVVNTLVRTPAGKLVKAAEPQPHWMIDPSRKTALDREAYGRTSSRAYYYGNDGRVYSNR